jgi:lambda repressor-like predicted transcriptional regulator
MTSMTPLERGIEISNKLRKKRKTQTWIAHKNHVSHTAVWNVIYSKSESKRLKESIAKILGEKVEDLWPEEDDDEERAA